MNIVKWKCWVYWSDSNSESNGSCCYECNISTEFNFSDWQNFEYYFVQVHTSGNPVIVSATITFNLYWVPYTWHIVWIYDQDNETLEVIQNAEAFALTWKINTLKNENTWHSYPIINWMWNLDDDSNEEKILTICWEINNLWIMTFICEDEGVWCVNITIVDAPNLDKIGETDTICFPDWFLSEFWHYEISVSGNGPDYIVSFDFTTQGQSVSLCRP